MYKGHITPVMFLPFSAVVAIIVCIDILITRSFTNIGFFIYSVMFSLSSALRLSSDTDLFNLLTGRQSAAAIVSYITSSAIPLTMCMMMRSAIPDILRKISTELAAALMLNIICMIVFFSVGISDLPDTVIITHDLFYAEFVYAVSELYEPVLGRRRKIYTGMNG